MSEQSLLFGYPLNIKFKGRMRWMMLAWMFEILKTLRNVNDNTFPNSVSILDAYMSKRKVSRTKWKLVAAGSMWISMKLFEVEGCDRDSMVYICFHDDSHLRERYGEILQMEHEIHMVLDSKLLYESPLDMLTNLYFHVEKRKDQTIYELARNLAFRFYWNEDYQKFDPSDIGRSSLVLIYVIHAIDSDLLNMLDIQQAITHYQLLEGFKSKESWLDKQLRIT